MFSMRRRKWFQVHQKRNIVIIPRRIQPTDDPADDLIRRLRATGGRGQGGRLKAEAADEIERLRAEIAAFQAVGRLVRRLRVAAERRNPQ
jgi:hypothetical protein